MWLLKKYSLRSLKVISKKFKRWQEEYNISDDDIEYIVECERKMQFSTDYEREILLKSVNKIILGGSK